MNKPPWLSKKIDLAACRDLKGLLSGKGVHTVCQQALCPNISECFSKGVATIMILGDTCTRRCRFCGLKRGLPEPVSFDEPRRIIDTLRSIPVNYLVITSPTRDDLSDGGAGHFADTARQILDAFPKLTLELLIPDFNGNISALRKVSRCGARVIAHNLETVPSLYPFIREGADYARSLKLLRRLKELNSKVKTKSGIMLGLGEADHEVLALFNDLRSAGCDILTLGQYLPPSLNHAPALEYVLPEKFARFKQQALTLGFSSVASGPYVRSSYLAHTLV